MVFVLVFLQKIKCFNDLCKCRNEYIFFVVKVAEVGNMYGVENILWNLISLIYLFSVLWNDYSS